MKFLRLFLCYLPCTLFFLSCCCPSSSAVFPSSGVIFADSVSIRDPDFRIVAGRDFSPYEVAHAVPAVLVSKAVMHRYAPAGITPEEMVGRYILIPEKDSLCVQVIGVFDGGRKGKRL